MADVHEIPRVRHWVVDRARAVGAERDDGVVRIAVTDRSTDPPVVLDVGPTALGGRGVMLIDRLAHRWGVDPQPDGKTVWFEVAVEGSVPVARGVAPVSRAGTVRSRP